MKLQNLFLALMLALGLTFISCSDDDNTDAEEGCTLCTIQTPSSGDCEVTICDDGSSESNGSAYCLGEDILSVGGTQVQLVTSLEELGFFCIN